MKKTNYHIHTNYCDGKNSIEEMVQAAISRDFDNIGISSHAPLKYQNDWTMPENALPQYFKELERVIKKYQTQIKVYKGLEIDYYLASHDLSQLCKKNLKKLDYWIGSIHCLGVINDGEVAYIDDTKESLKRGIDQLYGGDSKKAVCQYYEGIGEMAESLHPDIIGHIDIIKKNNKESYFFDESAEWYQTAWHHALEKIKKSGSILEINTGGAFRYGMRCMYPSEAILKEAIQMQIPLTVNTDAHCPEAMDFLINESLRYLSNHGQDTVMVYNGKDWFSQKI